ncbi:GNAT family N-acetyltransferase [Falsiroseomonas bella]|uniref:GNAT family N-acetyltransferase n=1 Tax=Falsiroseomonas bella TaxID=2184016 RepID=UPI00130497EC|nr:GNAT family N-acetyltransferase [Falsiroseomonas bella]
MATDAAAVAALLRDLNDEPGLSPERITHESVARDLIGDPRALVLVAEQDGEAVGVATAHPHYDTGASRWGLFLNDLYVAPAARRRGIARALVGAVAAEARRTGGRFVWWNADEGDELALRFHRSLDVTEAGTIDFLLAGEAFERLAGMQER